MKKLLSMGLLTLCALTISQQQAQAWVNAKFSVGLNWQLQSGNNNVFWGAWKNGQVPGPEAFGQGYGGPSMYGPGGMSQPPASAFPYFGSQPNPQSMPQAQSYQGGFPETAPPALAAQNYGPANYYYNPYQTVSYQNASYYYPNYSYPNYSYPAYPQYYGQVPSYWYNNR
jgi:hypothetical protein